LFRCRGNFQKLLQIKIKKSPYNSKESACNKGLRVYHTLIESAFWRFWGISMKKVTKLLLALGGISAVGAGFAGGMINNSVKAAEPVKADTSSYTCHSKIYLKLNASYWGQATAYYTAHIWGGANGTTWPGIDLGSGSGTDLLSADLPSTYAGYTHIIIARFKEAAHTTEWNRWAWFNSNSFTANSYNYFTNANAWDSCDSDLASIVTKKSVTVEFGNQTPVDLGTELAFASNASFAPTTPTPGSGYEHRGWYVDQALNNAYAATSVTEDTTLYAKYTMTEETYATDFLSRTNTECSAGNVSSTTWSSLSDAYDTMSGAQQTSFKDAELAGVYASGTTVQKAAARYNEIVKRYGYTNFAGRTVNGAFTVAKASDPDSSSALVLGGLVAAAILAAGGYFFVRKKKNA
jgi:LPXTG-motif cell wall-anchored protein